MRPWPWAAALTAVTFATSAGAEASSPASPVPLSLSGPQITTTLSVLVFGFAVIVMQFYVIIRHKELFSSENILAIFVVPLIIVGTLILVTTGLAQDALAPVLGLFGTVVGYLIGNKDRARRDAESQS